MSECIFVQGPLGAAAGFYGQWLYRAARADDYGWKCETSRAMRANWKLFRATTYRTSVESL
jgi:hypothetical protein